MSSTTVTNARSRAARRTTEESTQPSPSKITATIDNTPLNGTAAAVLSLVLKQTLTCPELHRECERRYGPFFHVTKSAIFREVAGLLASGMITVKPGRRGVRGDHYRATPVGRRAFIRWVNEDHDGHDTRKAVPLLRATCTTVLPPASRAQVLAALNANYIAELRDPARSTGPLAEATDEFHRSMLKAKLALIKALSAHDHR